MSESRLASACRDRVVVSATKQRHDRRSVPEFHRPSRRSLMSDSTADALARGGAVLKRAPGGRVRRGRSTPSRMSRDNLPFCPPSSRPVTRSSRATGRPRSTINTGEPALRPSIKALKLFLVSVMLAFFHRAKIALTKTPIKSVCGVAAPPVRMTAAAWPWANNAGFTPPRGLAWPHRLAVRLRSSSSSRPARC